MIASVVASNQDGRKLFGAEDCMVLTMRASQHRSGQHACVATRSNQRVVKGHCRSSLAIHKQVSIRLRSCCVTHLYQRLGTLPSCFTIMPDVVGPPVAGSSEQERHIRAR